MKWNVFGWLLGLPVLALVWGLAIKGERAHINDDLERRAQVRLALAEIDWARPRFDGTEARLAGTAYSEEERQRALRVVRRTWGVWHVVDETSLVEEAPEYVWRAAVDDESLRLTGYVPSAKARRHILQAARRQFPRHAVRDEMRPARGAPGIEVWIDGIRFGLRQLMQLKDGGRLVAIVGDERLAQARLYTRHGETVAARTEFDATIAALPGIEADRPAFTF